MVASVSGNSFAAGDAVVLAVVHAVMAAASRLDRKQQKIIRLIIIVLFVPRGTVK
jgi:hypothetical protein